jgi:hypothetical protein
VRACREHDRARTDFPQALTRHPIGYRPVLTRRIRRTVAAASGGCPATRSISPMRLPS